MPTADDGTLSRDSDLPRKPGGTPGAQLFLALECDRPAAGGARHPLAGIDSVAIGRGADRRAARVEEGVGWQLRLDVPDRRMSVVHARLVRVLGAWVVQDAGSKNGTLVNGVHTERAPIADGSLLELGRTFFIYREQVADGASAPEDAAPSAAAAPGLATLLPSLSRELSRLEAVAKSRVSVAVRGETGTGKELAARAVHQLSGREGPFIAMNCGALPDALVESELLGHRRGAFTGAAEDRPGMVRSADRGTLFLDEIGDLPLPAQAAFLRVLEQGEVQPVGASRPVKVDFRLVTATHRDLDTLVAEGKFRADLLARLSGFELRLPPLRERREDFGLITGALLKRLAPGRADEVRFTTAAARALFRHAWPLNIRELEKCLGAALVLAGESAIELDHLPETIRETAGAAPSAPLTAEDAALRDRIVALLTELRGNVTAVARAMDTSRMQLHRWMRRCGIDPKRFRAG